MRMIKLGRTLALVTPLLALTLLGACDESATEDTGTGRVQILLTDAPFPFDMVAEANVTITDVVLKGQDADTVLLSDVSQPFNLLDFQNGITTPLADIEVGAGTYNQLRIVVSDSASVVLKEGGSFRLKIPSGSQSGIKVKLDSLVIADGDLAQITIDFDVEDSFVVQGNPNTPAGIKGFIFKPVIKAKSVKVNGEEVTNE